MEVHEDLLRKIAELLEERGIDRSGLESLVSVIHPVDLAYILQDLGEEDKLRLFNALDAPTAAQVLDDLDEDDQRLLLERADRARLAKVIQEMAPDEGADLMEVLSDMGDESILEELPPAQAREIRKLSRYDPETAGGLMTTHFVSLPQDTTAEAALRAIQGAVKAETVAYLYACDEDDQLKGALSIRELLMASPQTPLRDIMTKDLIVATVDEDQEVVARKVARYDLGALPVVDEEYRLKGVVTFDDVMDVMNEEASEDIYRLGGTAAVDPVRDTVARRGLLRMPWLLPTILGELGVGWIILAFRDTPLIETMATLMAFIPIMMATGGNVGLQSSTLIVRGLATGEVTLSDAMRVILSESKVGLLLGLCCGVIAGGIGGLLVGNVHIGLVVFIAMVIGNVFSATIGTILPLLCHRLGIDPAISAGPFITSLNDITSTVLYFTTALLLQGIL